MMFYCINLYLNVCRHKHLLMQISTNIFWTLIKDRLFVKKPQRCVQEWKFSLNVAKKISYGKQRAFCIVTQRFLQFLSFWTRTQIIFTSLKGNVEFYFSCAFGVALFFFSHWWLYVTDKNEQLLAGEKYFPGQK